MTSGSTDVWSGVAARVVDRDGEKLGEIDVDRETNDPEWALVNTGLFGTKPSFVPLKGAAPAGEDVRVAYATDQVKDADAPSIDPDEEEMPMQEEEMPMPQTTTQPDAGSTAEQAKEQVKQQAEQTKEQVQEAGAQAKDKLREQVDQRSTQAGERVGATAQDVRSVAEELRKQGKDQPAKLAEQAADRAERVGGYLKESDADRILRDVEDFGREKPWAVALGGLALGFAASRFLKASSTQRYGQLRIDPYTPRPARPDEPATGATAPPERTSHKSPRSPADTSA